MSFAAGTPNVPHAFKVLTDAADVFVFHGVDVDRTTADIVDDLSARIAYLCIVPSEGGSTGVCSKKPPIQHGMCPAVALSFYTRP